MADVIKMKDVYEADGLANIEDGTPVIEIAGEAYDLAGISLKMAESDEDRGFPRSVVLDAMKALAGYESKGQKKAERDEKVRQEQEAKLKAQETVIKPLFAEIADMLAGFEAIPAVLLSALNGRISFKTGVLSFDVATELDPAVLQGFADSLGNASLGLKYKAGADGEAGAWVPSLKSQGNRSKGAYALQDGVYRLLNEKGREAGADEDFRFVVRAGAIYVSGEAGLTYCNGKDFLLQYTVETGNPENPTRPFSQPSKRVLAISAWERAETETEAERPVEAGAGEDGEDGADEDGADE